VLHTWTRDLRLHPHVHCIVTGGGLSADGSRWVSARSEHLFPGRVLAALSRGKLLAGLDELRGAGQLRLVGACAELGQPVAWADVKDTACNNRVRWSSRRREAACDATEACSESPLGKCTP
jgi:hypothetical protein